MLQARIDRDQDIFNRACIGRTLDVLFEKQTRYPGQIVGRSAYLQPIHVTGHSDLIGTIAPVTISELDTYSLFGTIAHARTSAQDDAAPALAGA